MCLFQFAAHALKRGVGFYLPDRIRRLLFPPPPYAWSEDGEHDGEILFMPLSMMEDVRKLCGVEEDGRPANEPWITGQ